MQGSCNSFSLKFSFAVLAIIVTPAIAAAQDMPPILAPPVAPVAASAPPPMPVSPSAEAVIPPAAVGSAAPIGKPHVAAALPTHHSAKPVATKKHLAAARAHAATHRVALGAPERNFVPGTAVPPPGYYSPGPYQRLVYGGPPFGPYGGGWGGYRGRYRYYP
jgi:hypothetical protein